MGVGIGLLGDIGRTFHQDVGAVAQHLRPFSQEVCGGTEELVGIAFQDGIAEGDDLLGDVSDLPCHVRHGHGATPKDLGAERAGPTGHGGRHARKAQQ
ncbi:hypothetical protein D3C86_1539190 [compost metagenome]